MDRAEFDGDPRWVYIQDSFFERYLTIEAILDSILNCKLVLLSSYQFESWDFWGMGGGYLFMFIDDLYCMNYPLSEIYGTHPVPIYTFSFIMEQWIHGYALYKVYNCSIEKYRYFVNISFFPFQVAIQHSIL